MALTLNYTILNPDFVIAELDKLDTTSLIKEQLIEQIPQELEPMTGVIETTFVDLEPWLKEQVRNVIYDGYDYFMGRSESLNIVISTEPITESLRDNLWEAIQQSPPPELAGLSPAMVKQYFDQLYEQEISNYIPPTFEINESLLPPEVMTTLEQVRQGIGYFNIAFKGLIALAILLVIGIILINREVRTSARGIGVTCLVVGALGLVEVVLINPLVNRFVWPQIAQIGMPAQLQAWVPQLLNDILVPLQWYSIGLLIAGIVLIVVSKIYKRQPSD